MRIVAGRFKGTALTPPSSDLIRPTSDKVREAMFNILMHGAPAVTFEDAKVLDLFAGTGALGFEALSRGAARCVFVDNSGQARAILRQNAETLGVSGIVKHLKRDATALGGPEKLGACDLAFVDPPYGR
ncbi:MAG: RsmD family RNA methyltransferase, partial [Pseudomonadota bacterium]